MRRRRRRVTGRFYVFLLVICALILAALIPSLNLGSKEAVIMTANAEYSQMMDCVLIRDESVITADSTVRIEYTADEGTLVNAGDPVAQVYTAGYSESLLSKLEETRAKIQDYHKNTILNNIKDSALERCDMIVDMMVREFKNLVNHTSRGSLLTASQQLETAMVNRQEYLRANKREDTKLTKLYDEESARMASIQSWRRLESAKSDGVVSFYIDGYENDLNAEKIESVNTQTVRTVLAGGRLSGKSSAKTVGVYRLVNQNRWFVAVVTDANTWSPVVGQQYYLQLQGFEDLAFNAYVTNVQKESGSLTAVFEINEPMGALIYQRTGKAVLSISLSGLSVNAKALSEQNGQAGVWLYDVPGGTFVPVNVFSNNGSVAIIQPLVDGAINIGQRVLIK